MKQKIISIEATTLSDAWFQLVWNALEYGRDFKIDQGSFAGSTRKEFDFIVAHILRPWERDSDGFPLIPEMPEGMNIPAPVDHDYLIDYAPYLLSGETEEKESYTYGQRLNNVSNEDLGVEEYWLGWKNGIHKPYQNNKILEDIILGDDHKLSQVELAIHTYKNEGYRNNQMCLQVAQPSDILLLDPPCLRHIDTRIQDGKLYFYPYFRSWDLWSGFPANVAGISMLQEHMAGEIGVEQGEMICTSKGLHLYDYVVDFAKMRCMVDDAC